MKSAVFLCLFAVVLLSKPQVEEAPAPTPVPFTPEPRQLQWRIGFDLGNAIVLETPELNPDNDATSAIREANRVLPNPFLDVGLGLLPVSKVNVRTQDLVNPRQWTIVDLRAAKTRKVFQWLGVFMGRRLASSEGGYHLVSRSSTARQAFVGIRREPSPEDLVIGFAGPLKTTPRIHGKLSETKWENLLPVEDPASLPPDFESAKKLLAAFPSDTARRFLYGTSIEALIRNRPIKLWLLNYSHPDTSLGNHPWGIFEESASGLRPLYVYNPPNSNDPFVAYFTASIDLDQDGVDELVVEASYRTGTAFKVIANRGGKYQEIFTSYYRGPES